eukprot:409034-Prymnesium_polylepis.1
MTAKRQRTWISEQYEQRLAGVSIEDLADLFPIKRWKKFKRRGWALLQLSLSEKEKRFIRLSHHVALAELGVDPCDPETYENAKHIVGYDSRWGWLRNPTGSLAQVYLATHPRLYKLHVGLYARLMIEQGL